MRCLKCQAVFVQTRDVRDYFSRKDWVEIPLCPSCWRECCYFELDAEYCTGCGRPFSDQEFQRCHLQNAQGKYCEECAQWLSRVPHQLVRHQALGPYAYGVKEALHAYKFQGDFRQVYTLSAYLSPALRQFRQAMWVVLPNSPESIAHRGFRPTYEILKQLQVRMCDPFTYVGDGQHQAMKNRRERLALQQPFALRNNALNRILQQSKQIVIFDDVYTTGATLMCAKRCLVEMLGERWKGDLRSLTLVRD